VPPDEPNLRLWYYDGAKLIDASGVKVGGHVQGGCARSRAVAGIEPVPWSWIREFEKPRGWLSTRQENFSNEARPRHPSRPGQPVRAAAGPKPRFDARALACGVDFNCCFAGPQRNSALARGAPRECSNLRIFRSSHKRRLQDVTWKC
jgi:hypothetical protein